MTRHQPTRSCKKSWTKPTWTKPTKSKVHKTPFAFDMPGWLPSTFTVKMPRKTVYVCASRFRADDCDFTICPF
jgi:hypothetical protein